jgi:hypothetical protein
MKLPYMIAPEDSRNQMGFDITTSFHINGKAAAKIALWVSIGIFLTTLLSNLR